MLLERNKGKPPVTMQSFTKLVDAGELQAGATVLEYLGAAAVAEIVSKKSSRLAGYQPASSCSARTSYSPQVDGVPRYCFLTQLVAVHAVGPPPAPAADPPEKLPPLPPQVGGTRSSTPLLHCRTVAVLRGPTPHSCCLPLCSAGPGVASINESCPRASIFASPSVGQPVGLRCGHR
jgi:hypothetical protein